MSLKKLIYFFNNYNYQLNQLQLNQCTKITDLKKCVESLICILENHPGNKGFIPYYNLLLNIYKKINDN